MSADQGGVTLVGGWNDGDDATDESGNSRKSDLVKICNSASVL